MDNNKNNLKITKRDIEIFQALSKYHLTGQMIFELSRTFKYPFTSAANTRARLKQLYQAGYLKRDERLMRGRGNNENYYFLTRKAASFFPELHGVDKKHAIFQPIKIGNQAHSFAISEVMVKMELDINQRGADYQLMGVVRENNFIVKGHEKRTIKPDRTIFLQVGGQNHLLFLEVDLSTEVVSSVKPQVRTFRRKIEVYSEFKNYFQQNCIIQNVGRINGYRVLIVCKSEGLEAGNGLAEMVLGKEKGEME